MALQLSQEEHLRLMHSVKEGKITVAEAEEKLAKYKAAGAASVRQKSTGRGLGNVGALHQP